MAGGEQVRPEVVRRREEVSELEMLIAGHAGDRRLAGHVGLRERLDHFLAKPRLVIQNVVGNSDPLGHVASVVNVLAGAARPLAMGRLAMVVELHGDADDVVAFIGKERRHDGRVDSAGHGHNDARVCWRLVEVKTIRRAVRDVRDGGRRHRILPGEMPALGVHEGIGSEETRS